MKGGVFKKKQNEKKTQTKEGVRVEMEIWQLSLRSQVNASAPGLLRCRVASPPHGATLELPSWTCCWLSVSQQFHHLSCRDCYSSKSNKDFNQSISNSAEIVNFPARWLMEFITKKKKKKKVFCTVLQEEPALTAWNPARLGDSCWSISSVEEKEEEKKVMNYSSLLSFALIYFILIFLFFFSVTEVEVQQRIR